MASDMRAPPPLNFNETNMADAWTKWFQSLKIYMLASKRNKESEIVKIAILLNLIGDEGIKLYNTFKLGEDEKFDDVVQQFEARFKPKKNLMYERFKFYKCTQQRGQPYNNYFTELKALAASCEFTEEDNMVRDKIVLDICDDDVREKLLIEPNLTLERAMEMCKIHDVRKKQATDMSKMADTALDAVKKKTSSRYTKQGMDYEQKQRQVGKEREESRICHKCGREHGRRSCPAYGKRCLQCGKIGHFAISCKREVSDQYKGKWTKKNNDNIDVENEESSDEFYIDAVGSKGKGDEWAQEVIIEGKPIKFKLDTGAQCNILPLSVLNSLEITHTKIKQTEINLLSYGDFKLKPIGAIILRSIIKDNCKIKYIVVDVKSKPILGLNTCSKLNLIKRVNIIREYGAFNSKKSVIQTYKSVFEGLGTFPGRPYTIRLRDGVTPVAQPARRIAKHLMDKLKSTLETLERNKVIQKVHDPTEWLNPLVIAEKPNKELRLCLDPKHLNEAIKEERYQLPSQEEMLDDLEGKTLFSVLDLKDSFHQIELDRESSNLCTFATPFNRYKFTRMPFGIKTAAEVFQKKNMELFGHIKGVKIYIDDIFIAGNKDDHDEILREVLDTAEKAGITFNKNKFQFRATEIKMLGHIVSAEGVRVDPDRIRAINALENPKDKKELLRILGILKYLGQFIPNLSQITAPLRELTKETIQWKWEEEHDRAIKQLKQLLTKSPILSHYNPSKQQVIQTDASKDGLGSVLLQEGRPIAYASRSLTINEKKFAQIEKELLAICFAVEKFHHYIYGCKVQVQTDHKPLVDIHKKDINKVPARLQRMLLKLFKYDLEVTYLKGQDMVIADALSRAYLQTDTRDDPELQYVIHEVIKQLPMSDERKKEFREATSQDPTLKIVKEYIKNGWPKLARDIHYDVRPYLNVKSELTEEDDLIFYGDRLVVPNKLRSYILKILHEGHQGIVKSKMRAKEVLYWPHMTREIEDHISQCGVCQMFRNSNPRQPLIPHEIPEGPWQKLAMDIAYHNGNEYLIVMDYFSKWLEILKLKKKDAHEVIKILKPLFSTHGYPQSIISDNMPFASYEFRLYLNQCNIKGITTSPNYARSNGMAERAVGMAKKMLGKSEMVKGHISEFLLSYRSTPIPEIGLSPAQLLFNRRIRDKLPNLMTHLRPKLNKMPETRERMKKSQTKQKTYYDRGTKTLPEIQSGSAVLIRKSRGWEKGIAIDSHPNPRSYVVKNERGNMIRRNREHLILVKQEGEGENREAGTREKPYNLRDRRCIKRPVRYVQESSE